MKSNLTFNSPTQTSATAVSRENDLQRKFEQSAQQKTQREITRDQAILDTAKLLKELDQKLDSERNARQTADREQLKLTIRWNKINLAVGITGILVGIAGVIVAIVALFIK